MAHLVQLFLSSTLNFAIAQTAEVAAVVPQAAPPSWMQFVPFGVIIIVFYFFLIRPQAKKQKETQNFLGSLKVSDLVITNSGILGRITNLAEAVVTLEVANGVQIKFLRSQIMGSQEILKAKTAQ